MPIDASIYSNVRAPMPEVNLPSPVDSAQKAMALSHLGMQLQQSQLQTQQQQALRQAYAQNTDENGNLNKQGVISSLARMGMGHMIPEVSTSLSKQEKEQADAQTAQMQAMRNKMDVGLPKFADLLTNVPVDQRATVYPKYMADLKAEGIDFGKVLPDQYDEGAVKRFYAQSVQQKEYLDKQLTQSQIAKNEAEAGVPTHMKLGAEELGKFNEDVNNASSRKTTGSLIDARTRADRIMSILNSGAKPGETQQQRIARLNQYMPQIGTEVGLSLASIMQGGVPNEELQKKLSPDTMGSNLATLKQRWSAEPSAANQGALLDAYGDVAKKLREFSAGQLQQITSRARAAYPYANKYYSKQMDQIGSQIAAPPSGGGDQLASGSDAMKVGASSEKLAPPKPGETRRGYVFNGGEPSDKRNWKKAR